MAQANFDEALRRLLAHEGGYANHPADPGGPTNHGITLAVYRQFMRPDATAADVRAMRVADAKAIYRAKYWNALSCDQLPGGVDYAVFDYGVNSGTGRAAKVLQRIVGACPDGIVGPVTLARTHARDPASLAAAICDERLAFLRRLRTWPVFGTGWSRRVADVRAAALAMAAGASKAPLPDLAPAPATAGRKGVVPLDRAARTGSVGAIVATGGAAAAGAQRAGIRPLAVAAIVAVTVALALLAWLFWRQRRAQEAAVTQA